MPIGKPEDIFDRRPGATGASLLKLSHCRGMIDLMIEGYNGNEIAIEDSPKLQSVYIHTGGPLKSVRLENVPQLSDLNVGATQSLATVEFRQADNMRKFAVSTPSPPDYGDGAVPPLAIPVEIRGLASLGKLKQLELSGGPISPAVSANLSKLTSLETLSFRGSQLTDALLAQLHSLQSLHELDLSETDVSAFGLTTAANVPHLVTLKLRNAKTPGLGKSLLGLKAAHPGITVVD